jgi:dienelactone hydrolase
VRQITHRPFPGAGGFCFHETVAPVPIKRRVTGTLPARHNDTMRVTHFQNHCGLLAVFFAFGWEGILAAQDLKSWQSELDRRVTEIETATAKDLSSPLDWTGNAALHRKELLGMLGLDPLPERTPLNAVVTGTLDHPEFTVEKIYFQSSPRLYVTGDLYIPKDHQRPLPAILYVCGHSQMREGGVTPGNKTGYQHHPEWFARHGFVSLAIDTIQLGEIEGTHHGTHHLNMWWWNSRGYTPAGVETWNGMRALDYLQSRPEVDPARLGVTGRSGGGAYTWYIAAVDERVKAAVPVAGITDLRNHIVDGVIDGHCDCMFFINSKRWDFEKIAALVAPRALLIANTDKDTIFPLDGVQRVHKSAAQIYSAMHASDSLGLLIAEGPHKDTQELQVASFRWFKRFLGCDPDYQAPPAVKLFKPSELKVLQTVPLDQRNTDAHEWFVKKANPKGFPLSHEEWKKSAAQWISKIRAASFAGWPTLEDSCKFTILRRDKNNKQLVLQYGVQTDGGSAGLGNCALAAGGRADLVEAFHALVTGDSGTQPDPPNAVNIAVLDEEDFSNGLQSLLKQPAKDETVLSVLLSPRGFAMPTPSGIEARSWTKDPKELTRIKRRYMLTGETLDSSRVFDIARMLNALHRVLPNTPIRLSAKGTIAVNALYASLFCSGIESLEFERMPTSHDDINAPDYLNVLRVIDIPQTLELARTRAMVTLKD